MFITNLLPRHHHPVMNYERFDKVTDDHFAVVIETADPLYQDASTRRLLEETGALEVVLIPEEAETVGSGGEVA